MAKKAAASTSSNASKPATGAGSAKVATTPPGSASAGTPGAAGSATIEATRAVAPSKPAKPAVQREVGLSVGAEQTNGKSNAAKPTEISHAMIAEAAYFLSQQGAQGSPDDHWRQAESQLRSR